MVKLTESHGITPVPLVKAGNAWDDIVANASYVPYEYLQTVIHCQSVYVAEKSESSEMLDVVLFDGERPVGIWPLNLRQNNGVSIIGSNAEGVLPPLYCRSASRKQRKAISAFALEQIDIICREAGLNVWCGNEALTNGRTSNWHKAIMEKGATLTARHDLYVDLGADISEIKSHFRKSYRPLITKAMKLWQVQVIDAGEEGVFKAFRALHIEASGRETRSKNTWELQREAVDKGNAFLVLLKDSDGRLVGAALFQHSREEGIYSVAAYNRSLFDQPLGHLVQMTAIEHMKALGLKYYRIGYRPYPGDDPAPDEKELNIGFFKEGFSSHTRLVLVTNCPVPATV